jgi:hypothetical protein
MGGFSPTLKVFAMNGVVVYLGLALSAFVYIPFGEQVMRGVQERVFEVARGMGKANTTWPGEWRKTGRGIGI